MMEFKATGSMPIYHYFTAQRLESDRVPCGFHFNGIENPIGVFPVPTEVISDCTPNVTLDVDGGAGLQFRTDFFVAAGIDDCIDIHMTREMRRELAAITCEEIENAGRKVTRRDDFGKGKRGECVCDRSERDDAVAAGDDGGNNRRHSEQSWFIGRQCDHNTSR